MPTNTLHLKVFNYLVLLPEKLKSRIPCFKSGVTAKLTLIEYLLEEKTQNMKPKVIREMTHLTQAHCYSGKY